MEKKAILNFMLIKSINNILSKLFRSYRIRLATKMASRTYQDYTKWLRK